MKYDVAVGGLGAMGSAILAHCAARRANVIGLEQFGAAHELGSSTGKSRMIRKAYFEDPAYVPLLLRAYDLWHELEEATGRKLLEITGLLMVGEEQSSIIRGACSAAHEHDLPLEILSRREIALRYPALKLLPDDIGLFEPDGGVLAPERAIEAHLQIATRAGAEIRFGCAMAGWLPNDGGFEIELRDGSRIATRTLILAFGPWFARTLGALGVSLRVQRNVQAWFAPSSDRYSAGRFPPFLLERAHLPAPLYGFPDFGDGVKAAFHSHGLTTAIDELNREIVRREDIVPIVAAMENWMPGAAANLRTAKVCPYSLTPDGHFVVDHHPAHPGLILCGGFSGHGFKIAPVIGEIAADLALEGGSRHAIDFLSLRRFAKGGEAR